MPKIKVDLEFDYPAEIVPAVPAGELAEHQYVPPEGWRVINFGVLSFDAELRINTAAIVSDGENPPFVQFRVENTDLVNSHEYRASYVLLKE